MAYEPGAYSGVWDEGLVADARGADGGSAADNRSATAAAPVKPAAASSAAAAAAAAARSSRAHAELEAEGRATTETFRLVNSVLEVVTVDTEADRLG